MSNLVIMKSVVSVGLLIRGRKCNFNCCPEVTEDI